jgi:hypothetical protein
VKRTTIGLCAAIILGGLGPSLWASWQRNETSDMAAVALAASEMAGRLGGPSSVLIVFDIDNTLLKGSASLGSDQWYNWQEELLGRNHDGTPDPYLAACDPAGLNAVQGILFELGSMVPPDRRTPDVVRGLQARGYKVMALTSRGTELRDVTLRELRRNGYDLAAAAPGTPRPGTFKLRPSDRPVSYSEGLFLSAGQDKGRVMADFLDQLAPDSGFKGIIFVDDSPGRVSQVGEAFKASSLEVKAFRYGREDSVVIDFKTNRDGVQELVKAQWERLKSLLHDVWNWEACPQPAGRAIR